MRVGLPSTSAVGVVHLGHGLEGPHDGVTDQVGEGDLATAPARQVVVDHDPVVDQQLGRDGPHAGRGRDRQRRLHVEGGAGGGAAQLLLDRAGGRLGRLGLGGGLGCGLLRGLDRGLGGLGLRLRGSRRCGRGWGGLRRVTRRGYLALPVVIREEVPPGLVNRLGVLKVLLVQLVDKPFVLSKACQRVCPRRLRRHGGNRPLPQIGGDVKEPVQGYSSSQVTSAVRRVVPAYAPRTVRTGHARVAPRMVEAPSPTGQDEVPFSSYWS